MKSSLIVVAFFCIGCLVGIFNDFQFDMHNLSMYILYALMLQVGISIGSNKNLKFQIKSLRPNMLLVPIATIVGTLLFSAFCQFIAESVECIRLYGSGKRICILFPFIHLDYSVQGGFCRITVGNGTWYDCFAGQYFSRNDGIAGHTTD